MTPKQTVEAVFAAFGRGDIPFILGRIAPDAVWRQPATVPYGGDYRGPEGAGQFFSMLAETTETTMFEVDEIIEQGENVFSFGRHTGKGRATGRSATTRWAFRWKVRDGKVALYDGYVDSAAIAVALG
jgi:ketosteroid isomerase-like protein